MSVVQQPRIHPSLRRRSSRSLQVVTAVSAVLLPALVSASPWQPDPNVMLPNTGNTTTQKVELVDINHDGFVDIVFANSSGDLTGNENNAQPNQLLMNDVGTGFTEQGGVFEGPDNAYVIKAGDIDNDGDADLVVGVNFFGTSYVLLNEGGGVFTPQDIAGGANKSIGDLELGDVDGDGNLDIVATDWGMSQPYGDGDDFGGPFRLWLGNGDGSFTDGSAKLPMSALTAWSYDIELVDIDNDYALDIVVSSRGSQTKGSALHNDGAGNFTVHPVPTLHPPMAKNVSTSFLPMDFNGDGYVDLVTLQDGGGQGACVEIDGNTYCGKRNSVLINDKAGQFIDNQVSDFWPIIANSPKLDFDAASLDFNSDGRPDFVVTGVRLGGNDVNSRLLLSNMDGTKFESAPAPLDAAFPVLPGLTQTFGLMFADFNRDGREDVAVAQRDGGLPNFVLFGREDPADGIAVDTTPPRIYDDGFETKLGTLLYFGDHAGFQARVNDYKTPTHWHDYRFDENLASYNLTGDGAGLTTHMRRLPYMEFALGLDDPNDIVALADGDSSKFIAPSIWSGEALWRVGFEVPYNGKKTDTLTWQYCAIDAANNKTCVGPFSVMLGIDPNDCGDGVKEEWEACDEDSPTCVMCEQTCGDGVCQDPAETFENCPQDCTCGDGICQPDEVCPEDCGPGTESDTGPVCGDNTCEPGEVCAEDCGETDTAGCNGVCEPTGGEVCPEDCSVCGDGICSPGEENKCEEDCPGDVTSDGICPDGAAAGPDGQCQLDDDGCGCSTEPGDPRGLWASLLLLGVFGVRRSRKRA